MLDLDDPGQRVDQAIAEIVGAGRAYTVGEWKDICKVSRIHTDAHALKTMLGSRSRSQEQGCLLSAGRHQARTFFGDDSPLIYVVSFARSNEYPGASF
ncbi:hypothetical protein CBA19CS22_25395 [Caballeronia novacaledonica]|uniref:Uncharacterized protein n=1 Tax=Caballeronia novacaledonica TaxID=1544861 RepID=A0ACB5QYP4_9BURK|nr:hypothetical protein CBA19CS22_25395 [Caballeronia novacaledonica]